MKNFAVLCLYILCASAVVLAQQATNLSAFHRSGQTFLTWNEASGSSEGDTYRIYRHTSAINASNLASAVRIAEIPHNSGYYRREANRFTPPHPDFVQTR